MLTEAQLSHIKVHGITLNCGAAAPLFAAGAPVELARRSKKPLIPAKATNKAVPKAASVLEETKLNAAAIYEARRQAAGRAA